MLTIFFLTTATAQNKLLTVDDLFDPEKRVNFNGNPPAGMVWLDGVSYLQRGRRVNAVTGQSEPFYDTEKMQAALQKLPGVNAESAKQLSGGRFMMNGARTAALINFANDLFYYKFGSDEAVRLTNSAEERLGRVARTGAASEIHIHVVDVATQRERSLTSDGNSKLFNGRLDWVYQEEVYGRGDFKAYWWSPDSSRIAYLQLDESEVKDFTVVDHIPNQQNTPIRERILGGLVNPLADRPG